MNNEEKDYILLNKLFGACLDMVQGTGGNISVKEEHLFGSDLCYIKSSGVALSNTDYNQGYVVCNLEKLRKAFQEKSTNYKDCILKGEGRPSMEVFFHILPAKYIVHLHPTSMMNLLCQSDLRRLQELFPTSLCLPFVQPGQELAELIHTMYEKQSIVFLQNHGVIFLENDLDSLIHLISSTFQVIQDKYPALRISDILYMYETYKENADQYIKSSFLIPSPCRVPRIYPYTPDLHLFLAKPFEQSVTLHKGCYYIKGPTKEYVENLEQLFASYLLSHFQDAVPIPVERTLSLEQDPQEQRRMAMLKERNQNS